jgi:hypothetical protein
MLCHVLLSIYQFLIGNSIPVLVQPVYFPDLSQCNFWLFARFKEITKRIYLTQLNTSLPTRHTIYRWFHKMCVPDRSALKGTDNEIGNQSFNELLDQALPFHFYFQHLFRKNIYWISKITYTRKIKAKYYCISFITKFWAPNIILNIWGKQKKCFVKPNKCEGQLWSSSFLCENLSFT